VIRQSGCGIAATEVRAAGQAALLLELPILSTPIDRLGQHADALAAGALPVGSVEFVRTAMDLLGIPEPASLSYPAPLRPFLGRWAQQMPVGQVRGTWFVKPTQTKLFTGFVWHSSRAAAPTEDKLLYDEHDLEQLQVLRSLPSETLIWVVEPVCFQCEWRYYVLDAGDGPKVIGSARYDADGLDSAPEPGQELLQAAIKAMSSLRAAGGGPVAYSLDLGVLAGGATVLVEVNDGWALGLYGSGLAPRDYLALLTARWRELLASANSQLNQD
jgi:hypothetical protein